MAESKGNIQKRQRKLSTRNFPSWVPQRFHTWWLSYAAILVWYGFNISFVLSGKVVFAALKPPPAALTCLHLTTGFVLSSLYLAASPGDPDQQVSRSERYQQIREFAPAAVFFGLNIFLSNLCTSLSNNASFTATIKALTPCFTFFIYAIKEQKRPTLAWMWQLAAIMVVIAGVLVSASADSQWTLWALVVGIAATSACSLMAIYQTDGLQKADPMVAMNAQAPTCILILLAISVMTESETMAAWWLNCSWETVLLLVGHGVFAFSLNLVAQACAAVCKPVQKTIAGNLKVAFIYWLECMMWQACGWVGIATWCQDNKLRKELAMSPIVGSFIIFAGAFWYAKQYEAEKNEAAKLAAAESEKKAGKGD